MSDSLIEKLFGTSGFIIATVIVDVCTLPRFSVGGIL
jgi:hypothetical protein